MRESFFITWPCFDFCNNTSCCSVSSEDSSYTTIQKHTSSLTTEIIRRPGREYAATSKYLCEDMRQLHMLQVLEKDSARQVRVIDSKAYHRARRTLLCFQLVLGSGSNACQYEGKVRDAVAACRDL